MRIVHVSATFPPYFGGTGTVCFHNARVLAKRGHDVSVITARAPGPVSDPPGVTVRRIRPIARIGNAPISPQLVALPKDAIIHVHFPFYAGAEFAALSRRPYVVTYHQDVQLNGWQGTLTRMHDRSIGRLVLRRAKRLCPTSLDYFRSSTFSGLIPEMDGRIEPIPNGVDLDQFSPGPADPSVRERFWLPPDLPLALFVGSMDAAHYFKGIPTLLRVMVDVPDLALLLVGDGDLRSGYEEQAAGLGLSERVRFAGRVDSADLPAVYRAADVLVLPSETRGEAFGVVLLEAMASGRPVIASDLPGVRSVVSHGVDGLLTPPGDGAGLSRALHDIAGMAPERRQAMGAAGRAKVEAEYGWDRIGEKLEAMYLDVARETGLRNT